MRTRYQIEVDRDFSTNYPEEAQAHAARCADLQIELLLDLRDLLVELRDATATEAAATASLTAGLDDDDVLPGYSALP